MNTDAERSVVIQTIAGRQRIETREPVSSASRLIAEDLVVIIPAFNEAGSIRSVIERLKQVGCRRIRMVDNGSTDRTADIARAAGAEVISEPAKGYGMACWSGLQLLPSDASWILFCDADGCDDIEALPQLASAVARGADFVIGNRLAHRSARANLTLAQRFGNQLATRLIKVIWGAHFQDLGPMRLVNRALLERIDMQDRGFGWTVEMQIRVAQLRAPYAEIPVAYHARQSGRSKISGTIRGVLMAGSVILSTIAYHAIVPRRRAPPEMSSGDET